MKSKLHIGITGYIGTDHVSEWLDGDTSLLPKGQPNAPLLGVLIGELLKQGHKVSAFTTDTTIFDENKIIKASGKNFDFYICPARPRAWRFNKFYLGRAVDGFAYERHQLLKAVKQAQPDIIHAHWTYEYALAAIKTGLPHVITCHDSPKTILRYSLGFYRFIHYLMARIVFKNGKNFSAVSPYMASSVQKYTPENIHIIPNPVANYVLKQGYQRNNPLKKRIGLICNGWSDYKNPKPALIAFSNLTKIHPTAELHLFGFEFGINESAQKWCEKYNLNAGMHFHGITPHKQLIEQLSKLDLLLHPALEESFSVVIAEAMTIGLPIVAGKYTGAIPWVVGANLNTNQECCTVLTDVTNPDEILTAILTAFDHKYSERSFAGYTRSKEMFNPVKICKTYTSLYRDILNTYQPNF